MGRLTALIDRWLNFPSLDYILVAAASAAVAIWGPSPELSPGDRSILYQTLAAVSGVLLSVGILAITILVAVTPTERLARALDLVGPRLKHLLMTSVAGLLVTTAGFAGMFLTNSWSRAAREAALVGLAMFVATRFGRLWWLLGRILEALLRRPTVAGSSAVTSWRRPQVQTGDYRVKKRLVRSRSS